MLRVIICNGNGWVVAVTDAEKKKATASKLSGTAMIRFPLGRQKRNLKTGTLT
jgi:hypothetical protein